MADAIPVQSRASGVAPHRGPLGRLLGWVLSIAVWLVLGLFGNILFECVCVGLLWPDQGPRRSQAMLEAELAYLGNDIKASLLVEHPTDFATGMAADLHRRLYVDTGLTSLLRRAETAASRIEENPFFRQRLDDTLVGLRKYLAAAMIATQVYAVRVAVLVLAMPVFCLFGLVALVDGIVSRDLRRFGVGREHGQVYHLAKRAIGPTLTLPWAIYLAWPTTVHPNYVILPFALLFAVAVAVSAATFKKYL
ncbi:TIGR03747 family integrating conjugative element membrane protein [Methyloterricola oryzae]|uniref:TIGR03747 family integrating conjugative element membrane protein n=1 Tax=Methyloterricola oryzae TaxID=1495050 RepID=UPI0005EB7E52|nr:TIGR03747 family integrating conjugative element membrane protein [Methyloterricola oryzae]